jgi:hypothetical protein
MRMGLGVLAAGMAVSAHADAPQAGPAQPAAGQSAGSDSVAVSSTREKRLGSRIETTRLEAIVVSAGAVDRHNERFVDSRAAAAVLPMVSESAFLDGDDAVIVESR